MSLEELRRQALAARAEILREIEEEMHEEQRRLNEAVQAARHAERAARNAERAARNAIRSARATLRSSRPVKTRKRAPGANYEIAGRPAHLAPGAPLRSVEGKKRHSQTLALTRGKRSKAKY
jgi:hypothetical protein